MKLLLEIFTFFIITSAAPSTKLESDLHQFVKIIPFHEIRATGMKYLLQNPAFQSALYYLQSPEWHNLISEVVSKPPVQSLLAFVARTGIDIRSIFVKMRDLLESITNGNVFNGAYPMADFVSDVMKIIPKSKLLVLLNRKLNSSPDFKELWDTLTSKEAKQLVDEVVALPEVELLFSKMKDLGVKVKDAFSFMYQIFRWNFEY